MKRESVKSLFRTEWIKPIVGDDLEVGIVPSEARAIGEGDAAIVERAFVDFHNYTDAGQPVKNSRESRLELLGVLAVRRAIIQRLIDLNEEVARGEGSAVSA